MALFGLGFRPFFLLAGLSASLMMFLRIISYRWGEAFPNYFDSTSWHSHEMLFGYGVAVIAGFLLAAVGNWINHPMPKGKPLAALVVLWLSGRILPFFPQYIPDWLIAFSDWIFLPVLLAVIGIPIVRAKNVRNYGFLLVLGVMTLANAEVHLRQLGINITDLPFGITFMLNLLILMIVLMGGRVIPFFTKSALPEAATKIRIPVEWAAVGFSIALMAGEVCQLSPVILGILAGSAAILHALRLVGWHDIRVWKTPLLWVLHLGYAWIVVGYALTALAKYGTLLPFLATHAFTAGGIGMVTLGMMARVSLGHSGRPLIPPKLTVLAFALLNVSALLRVVAPVFFISNYGSWILLSGSLWILAYLFFLWDYFPMLLAPRVDGRPG
jgi:uncharacterized protein involved in response to NO